MKKWRYNPWVDELASPAMAGFSGNGYGTGLCGYGTPDKILGGGSGSSGYGMTGCVPESVTLVGYGEVDVSDGRGVGNTGTEDGAGGVISPISSVRSLCQEFEDIT